MLHDFHVISSKAKSKENYCTDHKGSSHTLKNFMGCSHIDVTLRQPHFTIFFFFSFKQTELIGDLETKKVKTYGDLSIGELGFLFNCPT